jgi:hypothetical protein
VNVSERRIPDENIAYTWIGKNEVSHAEFDEGLALASLLIDEVVFLNSLWWEDDAPARIKEFISVNVNCNDVFAWGCADGETLPYSEIENLWRMHRKDPTWGAAVWCIKRRGQKPQKPVEDLIRKAGIWNLDELGIGPNTQNAEVEAMRNSSR